MPALIELPVLLFFLVENKIHETDSDESDDDNVYDEEGNEVARRYKPRMTSTAGGGRFRKHSKRNQLVRIIW